MRHLDDGRLRRMRDEPLALSSPDREHYASCSVCHARFVAMTADADAAQQLLGASSVHVDPAPAYQRLRQRAAVEGKAPRRGWTVRLADALSMQTARFTRPLGGLAAAAALLAALTLTPAGSLAQQFITIFQPTQVTAVPVTVGDVQKLLSLRQLGTVHIPQLQSQQAGSASAASAAAGMRVLTPGSLPPSVTGSPIYQVVPSTTATFTFNATKAQRWAAARGKTLPAMPAKLDGSTLQLTTGVAVGTLYGANGEIPSLVIGQAVAPHVSSTGVTVKELESYLLSLPGISPQLKQAITSIGDPASTLPVPIPINMASGQDVTVQGVHGVLVGDSTGVGSGVVWEKGGIIYGVAGPLTQDQVLSIANSLH